MASLLPSSLFFIALVFIIISISEAREFLVGGNPNSWKVPSSTKDSLNKWAEGNRFHVGDSLVWNYDSGKDSVLQVTKEGYLSCNTSGPIAEHKDVSTKVRLSRPGPYYFIGGAQGACEEGEKLVVVVMSPRSHGFSGISPAPSPVEQGGLAAAPTSGGSEMVVLGWGLLVVLGMVGMLV